MNIPKITDVKQTGSMLLTVIFSDGKIKLYDCHTLLGRNSCFSRLTNPGYFNNFKIDAGGHGISWDDDIDISEYEIYQNGREINS